MSIVLAAPAAFFMLPPGESNDRRFFLVDQPSQAEEKPDSQVPMPTNREQRRQAQRDAKRKPKKARPYVPITNAMEYVTARATALTGAERMAVLQPARDGFKALREGVATYRQWADLVSAVAVGLAIEEQGKIRGLKEHFTAADLALQAVCKRVQDGANGSAWGRCTTLYFDEIAALREAIHLHEFQLKRVAVSELRAATEKTYLGVRLQGGQLIDPATSPQPEPEPIQEQLL